METDTARINFCEAYQVRTERINATSWQATLGFSSSIGVGATWRAAVDDLAESCGHNFLSQGAGSPRGDASGNV